MTTPVFSVPPVVMVRVATTFSEKVAAEVFWAESFTVTTMLKFPEALGVPLMTPAAERFKPAGSEEPLAAAHDQV